MIQTNQPFDQTFLIQDDKSFFPNIGFGFYYYSQKIYLGFAMPRVIEHDEIGNQKHYFFIGGGLINLSDLWILRPSVFLKYARGSSSVYDFSSLLIFKETFWIGGQIRSSIFSVLPDGGLEGSYAFLIHELKNNRSHGFTEDFMEKFNNSDLSLDQLTKMFERQYLVAGKPDYASRYTDSRIYFERED